MEKKEIRDWLHQAVQDDICSGRFSVVVDEQLNLLEAKLEAAKIMLRNRWGLRYDIVLGRPDDGGSVMIMHDKRLGKSLEESIDMLAEEVLDGQWPTI